MFVFCSEFKIVYLGKFLDFIHFLGLDHSCGKQKACLPFLDNPLRKLVLGWLKGKPEGKQLFGFDPLPICSHISLN